MHQQINMTHSLRADEIDFEALWYPLEQLCLNILNENFDQVDKLRWTESFSYVYKICVATPEPMAGPLYNRTKRLLERHVMDLCSNLKEDDNQNLLANYYKHWSIYKTAFEHIDKIFSYLNNQHLKKNKKLSERGEEISEPILEIKDLCIYIWQHKLILPLKTQLIELLMNAIKDDRLGLNTNQEIIKGVIHSFADVEAYKKDSLELYREIFEKLFIKTTGEWYKIRAEKYRSELNCSEYMKKVLQIIDIETLRCTKLVHGSSRDKVVSEIRARMVADHSTFLHEESEQMVRLDCWEDLHAIYKLLKPIENGLRTLIQQVQTHITQVGLEAMKQIVSSENPPKNFVESFISVYKKYSESISKVFKNDQLFVSALDKACSSIINHRINPKQPCRSPELLAKFCDSLLRKPTMSMTTGSTSSSKNITESEIDEKLSLSIIVFKYIDDKDVFQKFYSKNMARRLIFSQMASMESEELMINKLKQVCGYEFTSKIHKMYTDIDLSDTLRKQFVVHLTEKKVNLELDFSIYVLQAGSWPLGQTSIPTCIIPRMFERPVKEFEEFYLNKFHGRKLTWLYHHCSADVRLCYTQKKYLVTMQTFHLAIMLLFEHDDEISHQQIMKNTNLSDEQLNKHLSGLIECKLLSVVPDNNAVQPMQISTRSKTIEAKDSEQQNPFGSETRFRLVLDFSNKKPRFRITVFPRDVNYQPIRESNDSEQTHSSVDEDRKLYIQAAIVRVMKSRTTAKHNHLVQEVIGLTKSHFNPSVPMIKKCIEILIDKQYLERKPNAADEYIYMA